MLMNTLEPTWTEVSDKAKKTIDDDSKTWRGEIDGESIFGKIEEFKEVTVKKDGRIAHVLKLHNDVLDETYTVWCRGMLLRKLEAAGAEVGKVIKIEFVGMFPVASDPNRSYRSYKVFVAEGQ
jgi:hypothetical protein